MVDGRGKFPFIAEVSLSEWSRATARRLPAGIPVRSPSQPVAETDLRTDVPARKAPEESARLTGQRAASTRPISIDMGHRCQGLLPQLAARIGDHSIPIGRGVPVSQRV